MWAIASVISSVAMPYMINNVMKPYQRDRIYSLVGKPYVPQDPEERAELEKLKQRAGEKVKIKVNTMLFNQKLPLDQEGCLVKAI